MKRVRVIQIQTRIDKALGSLSFFEAGRDIDFPIKRVYYTYDVPSGGKRGGHAHKNLQQILFCPYGVIEFILDDGVTKEHILLDNPSKALLLGSGIWRDIIWKQAGSVLCVGTSEYYDESDYIRDYALFSRMKEEGFWHED